MDSVDLERATATLDAARLSNRGLQLPYRGPGVSGIGALPRFQPPKMPKTAVFRSNTGTPPECPSQSSLAPIVPARYQSRVRSPVLSENSSSHDERRVDLRRGEAKAEASQSRASDVSGSPTVALPEPRLSDYGRGLVSITRDFSTSAQKSRPGSRPY